MTSARDLVNSTIPLAKKEGMSDEMFQSFIDYFADPLIEDEFSKFIQIIENGDIPLETKTKALLNFNNDHRGIYKAEFGILKVNGCDTRFSVKLICSKTNQKFQYLEARLTSPNQATAVKAEIFPESNKKLNNKTVEKKAINKPAPLSKEGFFSSKIDVKQRSIHL